VAPARCGSPVLSESAQAPSLVLVHSPLVGPATWDALAPALVEWGYSVVVPDMTSTVTQGAPYWPRQVDIVSRAVEVGPVVLIGHSGAGPLLPAMANASRQVAACLFLDAGLPTPGKSWSQEAPSDVVAQLWGMARDGWVPPWPRWWTPEQLQAMLPDPVRRARFIAGCPPLPLAMFEEPRPREPTSLQPAAGYLQPSKVYQAEADRSRWYGWPVAELHSHHLAMLTQPELVGGALVDLLSQMLG
jgi:pimeloyl-ACP methyl ester carboxylesterase